MVQRSDLGSWRDLDRDALWVDYLNQAGMTYELMVSMPTLPGRTRRVLFWRQSGSDFGAQERAAVTLLRPHLYELWSNAERRRAPRPDLSVREWEVLRPAADGDGNAEIVEILCISVSTARKHMEHIFDRMGVRTRAAAAALAFPQDPHRIVGTARTVDRRRRGGS